MGTGHSVGRRGLFFCFLANANAPSLLSHFPNEAVLILCEQLRVSFDGWSRYPTDLPTLSVRRILNHNLSKNRALQKHKDTGLVMVRSKKQPKAGQVRSLMLREIKPRRTYGIHHFVQGKRFYLE